MTKREDGIVLIDPVKAKGRKDLVDACPYGHIWWNEELQLPQAWTFDAHLLDQGWKQTRGQQSCPTGAMRAIKVSDEEMARLAREEALEVMQPEAGTKPRVYYKNLWRYSKCFIGGSVAAEANGVVDCVEGATVRLLKDGAAVAETVTDNYGDFKFDRLDENSGDYSVEVSARGRASEDGCRKARRQHQSRRDQAVTHVQQIGPHPEEARSAVSKDRPLIRLPSRVAMVRDASHLRATLLTMRREVGGSCRSQPIRFIGNQ